MSSLISKGRISLCLPHMFPQNRSKYHMFLSFLVSAVKLHPFLLSRSHLSSSVQLCFERVVIFTVIVWFHRTSPPSLWSREELTKLSDPCCKPQSGQDLSQSQLQDSSLSLIPICILPAPFTQLEQIYVSSTNFQGTFEAHTRPLASSSWPVGICPGWGVWK